MYVGWDNREYEDMEMDNMRQDLDDAQQFEMEHADDNPFSEDEELTPEENNRLEMTGEDIALPTISVIMKLQTLHDLQHIESTLLLDAIMNLKNVALTMPEAKDTLEEIADGLYTEYGIVNVRIAGAIERIKCSVINKEDDNPLSVPISDGTGVSHDSDGWHIL